MDAVNPRPIHPTKNILSETMRLTEEQEEVVSITSGRHLVLAPPGSGKTEMLSQRIRRAIARGVDPKRMLCATFTNRAAFEMRERIGDGGVSALPDVGNLHHFCYRFLMSVGRLGPGRHVLDEVEQLEFSKEILDVLADELRFGFSRTGRRHDVTVIRLVKGGDDEERRKLLLERVDTYLEDCRKGGCSPYVDFLDGMLAAQQSRIGIPARYRSPMPQSMYGMSGDGLLRAAATVYTGLKRKFRCVDFNDLLNETFMYLEKHEISKDRKFLWVQIDEVQDLNPMQWRIVREMTADDAVSVYFGDAEQAIFSFLGATSSNFSEATSDCRRHFFRLNFRTTPVLLEILMRYSISALDSDWEFLPRPGVDRNIESRLCLAGDVAEESVAAHVGNLLSGGAENVAILVRTNREADAYESLVKPLGYRFAKVSGHDLFSFSPMRDFLAFVSLFNDSISRNGWACLFHRFADIPRDRATARHLVRELEAGGWDMKSLLSDAGLFASLMSGHARQAVSRLRHVRAIRSLRRVLKPAFESAERRSFRTLFEAFSEVAFGSRRRYSLYELMPGVKITDDMLADPETYEKAVIGAKERIERFLRYADHVYESDARSLTEILDEDWEKICKLKEADLLVGDEKVVISTIHKAKGRQFDAVIVPDVHEVLKTSPGADPGELRRLLYVAMSRTKRHLSLFGAEREIPEIACICKCFDPHYVSIYSCGDDEDPRGDWLWHWERLAEMNLRQRCDISMLEESVSVGSVPVARMAMKCCRYIEDRVMGRDRLFEVVRKSLARYERAPSVPDSGETCWNWRSAAVAKSLLANAASAIDGLRHCKVFDEQVMDAIRRLAAYDRDQGVSQSAFEYVKEAAVYMKGASTAVGDFLYSCYSHLRLAAASSLSEFGDDQWIGLVSGTVRDFEKLSTVVDVSHEETIRRIISVPKSDSYERRLRNLLRRRAMR